MIGSARDIVEECGVSRFLFTDFPLGNPLGKPDDTQMQAETLELADSMGALSLTLRSIAENSGKLGDDGPKAAKGFAKGGSSRGIAVIRYGSSSILHGGQ